IDGSFAPWVGALIPGGQPLLIVADNGREEEVITRLARVGYDDTRGYLKGGIQSWKNAGKEIDTISSVSADEFAQTLKMGTVSVIDVRKSAEFQSEHVENAHNVPLDFLNSRLAEIPKAGDVYLHCAGGYRSMIAASILKARGWSNVIDIRGGITAIANTDVPRTDYACSKSTNKI
ncbi:MAG TPA: rhodanese-like domain-containing protein, partial [Cyclobacteriaceae bacterium]|nr:rhodanese-like domain-containing protein [Cyclobacteriaceae bacterium]